MKEQFSLPDHVAIIPDGNRRWAKNNLLPMLVGHMKGYARVNELVTEAKKLGIKYVTVWAFSTENWSRPQKEVEELQKIIYKGVEEIHTKAHKEKSRFVHLGRKDRLGDALIKLLQQVEEETKKYKDFCLTVAIDYGGEDEINRAIKLLQESNGLSGGADLYVKDFLDTTRLSIPSPDLIIRTSGEYRSSGFMPLQSTYSEWYFDSCLFPDFDTEAFHKALDSYKDRKRRFGK